MIRKRSTAPPKRVNSNSNQGHIKHKPIATFERAYKSERAEMIWLPEHVAAFEKVAGPEIQLAVMLTLHTGQRQADLLALPWSARRSRCVRARASGRSMYRQRAR